MASSENLASIEQPWGFWPTFADSWISEAFIARDHETLTRALQKSLSDTTPSPSPSPSPFLLHPDSTPAPTPSVSGGSDPETPAPKRRSTIPVSGKATKRKSRASKRSTTTFIMADPANFRQMVQQVTGVRFGSTQLPVAPAVLKPEPHRPASRLQGCLPTLDTSAFLLSHHHHQGVGPSSTSAMMPVAAQPPPPPAMVSDGGAGFDFDSISSFPTLESWKVM